MEGYINDSSKSFEHKFGIEMICFINPIDSPLYKIGRRRPLTSSSDRSGPCCPIVTYYVPFESIFQQFSDSGAASWTMGPEHRSRPAESIVVATKD